MPFRYLSHCKYISFTLLLIIKSTVYADENFEHNIEELEVRESDQSTVDDQSDKSDIDRSILHQIVLYVPNRIFDVLDIVRLKVRVGPGFDVGLQITEPIRVYAGGHSAIYLGLPGPRQERIFPIPIGAEAKAGGTLSVLDGTVKSNTGTDYSYSEIAVELQFILVGFDVGIDLVEVLDLFAGFVFLEVREDDL